MRRFATWAGGVFAGCSLALLVAGTVGAFGSDAGETALAGSSATKVVSKKAKLISAAGYTVSGTVTFTQTGSGWLAPVQVVAVVQGLPPGKHGMHIHTVGDCTNVAAPSFVNAGGHADTGGTAIASTAPTGTPPYYSWAPVEANHPFHAGDLPNIEAGPGGVGVLVYLHANRFTLDQNPTKLLDADGAAVVVHLNEDKGLPDSTGANAGGARIACGVIQ